MKNRKDTDNYLDSNNVSDIYTFTDEDNSRNLPDENYVFSSEDNANQLGTDSNGNDLGIEDNDNYHQSGEEVNEDDDDREDNNDRNDNQQSQSSSSSSSTSTSTASSTAAASTSSVASTIAATAAAAVVVVVGGGIVLQEAYKEPTICEFTEVAADDNNIYFMLRLGTDEEKIDSGEETDETDCVIELSSQFLSYYDEIEAKTFGVISGEFNNLEYDTDYTLNVYRPTMLGADKEYLLPEGYMIRTPAKDGGDDPHGEDVPVEYFELSETSLSLTVGERAILTATNFLPENAKDRTVEWLTTDASVATVSDGIVVAQATGSAVIKAYCGNAMAQCEVEVTSEEEKIHATGISFESEVYEMEVGEELRVRAIIEPEGCTDEVTWETSDQNVSTVHPLSDDTSVGVLNAFSSGSTIISATVNGLTASFNLVVNPKTVHAEKVEIVYSDNVVTEMSLDVGDIKMLEYHLYPGNASDQSVTWTSSDPDVVEITTVRTYDCTIKALAGGSTIITAASNSDPDVFATLSITVFDPSMTDEYPIESIEFEVGEMSLVVGETYEFNPLITPDNYSDYIEWTSSNTDVATIEFGFLTAVGIGETEITATSSINGVSATCYVYVDEATMPVISYSGATLWKDALEQSNWLVFEMDITDDGGMINGDIVFRVYEDGSLLAQYAIAQPEQYLLSSYYLTPQIDGVNFYSTYLETKQFDIAAPVRGQSEPYILYSGDSFNSRNNEAYTLPGTPTVTMYDYYCKITVPENEDLTNFSDYYITLEDLLDSSNTYELYVTLGQEANMQVIFGSTNGSLFNYKLYAMIPGNSSLTLLITETFRVQK